MVQGKLMKCRRLERNRLKLEGVGQVTGSNLVGDSVNDYQTAASRRITAGGTDSTPVRTADELYETRTQLLVRIYAEIAECIRQGELCKGN